LEIKRNNGYHTKQTVDTNFKQMQRSNKKSIQSQAKLSKDSQNCTKLAVNQQRSKERVQTRHGNYSKAKYKQKETISFIKYVAISKIVTVAQRTVPLIRLLRLIVFVLIVIKD